MISGDAPCPVDYYIYYRTGEAEGALDRIRAMQATLAERTGITGKLMQRRDDAATLMEIYPGVTDTSRFEAALDDAVAAAGLSELVEPGTARHVERFLCV